MEKIKEHLEKGIDTEIMETEKNLKTSDDELELLEAKIIVEKKFFELESIDEKMREDVKYSLQALENMLFMEKERNESLRAELGTLKARKKVLNDFGESDLHK